jgi:cytochrome c-type biogenesis protein CcmH
VRTARLIGLVLCLVFAASPGSALAAQPRASFPDVEDEVMCDTCNVPLYIAESPRADQLRREIRVLIAQGETKQEIKDTLRERYGAAILALPQQDGFSLTAYLVPILVGLGLVVLAIVLLPRWRRRSRAPAFAAPAATLTDDDRRRLDDELARFDR